MKKTVDSKSLDSLTHESFLTIVKDIPDLIWIKDENSVYLACNKRFEEFFGKKELEIIGKTDYDFVDKRQADLFTKHDKEALDTKKPVTNYEELTFSDGHKEYIHVTKTLLYDSNHKFLGILGVGRDFTQQRNYEQQLIDTLEQLQQAQETANIGIWKYDVITKELQWSDQIYNIFEQNKKTFEATVDNFAALTHPDDRHKMLEAYENSLINKEKYSVTHRILVDNGKKIKYVQEQCKTFFNDFGKPISSIGTILDVTESYKLRQSLEKESIKYKALMENSSDAIIITNMQGFIVECSHEAKKLFGYSESEMLKLHITDLEVCHTKEEIEKNIHKATSESINFETKHKKKDSTIVDVSINVTKINIDGVDYLYASLRDITKEKKIQDDLKKALDRLELAINSTQDGLWDWDPITNKVFFSQNWKKMLGYEPDEIGDSVEEWSSRVHPDDFDKTMERLNNHFERKTDIYESTHRLQCKDGTWKWILDRGKAQFDENGKLARVIGYHTDLTKQKQSEEKLKEALERIRKDKRKYQTLMESSSDAIMVFNNDGKLIEYSQEAKKLLGYSDDEFKKLTPYDWDVGLKDTQIAEVMKDRTPRVVEFETKHKRKDGSIYDAFVRGITIKIDEEEYLYSSVKDITDQKKNQKKLEQITKELEKDRTKYKTLMENSSDAIFITNDQGFVIEYSKQFKELLGYKDEEVCKLHVSDFEAVHTKEQVKENICKNFSYEPVSFESRYRKKDGSLVDVSLNLVKIKIAEVDYFYCSCRDISDIKKYEQELIDKQNKLELAKNSASIGIWEIDLLSSDLVADDKALEIFEVSKEEFDGKKSSWEKMIDKEDLPNVEQSMQNSILYNAPFYAESKVNLKGDRFKYVKATGTIIQNEDKKPIKLLGTVVDITNEKLNNDRIKEQKEEFELIFNNSKDSIAITDLETNFLNCNDEYCKMSGYTKEEMLQTSCLALGVPRDREKIQKLLEDFFKVGVIKDFEKVCITKDGKEIITNMSLTLLPDKKRILINAKDISAKKEYERNLKEQKEEFEAIFTNSKDGIAIVDLESKFLDCNDAYLEMLEYTKEELLTKSCIDLTVPEEREQSIEALKFGIKKGYLQNYEKTCLTKTGKKIKINMSAALLPDKKRFIMVTKDMTFEKLLDEQSKLAAMGEMIGNIAHQWRQPLSVISASASGLSFQLDYVDHIDKEQVKETSNMILDQVSYLSQTIDDFRNFIKGGDTYKNISLKDTISRTFNLVDPSLKNNHISLQIDIKDDLIIVGNPNEIQQALINIINNAKDALKEHIKSTQDRFIFVSTTKLDEKSLELKITDSGGGIEEHALERIFEPYFTTKDEKTGTGIGLSMVDKIIRERHNGTIDVINEEYDYKEKHYKGATFKVVFKAT